ncbi:MAG: alpha/beta hydrolase fold domain-containing protein [Planctomycetota bacterium]|nr:alpha/beta hydrolase fold domain-containing protein [Planctomycetota bacterium]
MMTPLRVLLVAIGVALSATPDLFADEFQTDIVFAKRGDQELKFDIALPSGEGQMRPTVLCIHGGGWRAGSRASYHEQVKSLAKLGYVAATVEYRLTSVQQFPAEGTAWTQTRR